MNPQPRRDEGAAIPKTMDSIPMTAASLTRDTTIGQILMGRYTIRRVLGRGAMGEVLEVNDHHSGADYALKRVPKELVSDAVQMTSIRANFALVSQLTHPHIGTTRHLEIDPNSRQALVLMDLVRGQDLACWLVERRFALGDLQGPLPIDLVLGISEQIAQALDYAHSQPITRTSERAPKSFGILHRDLKPANVMVETGREYRPGIPYLKLVDFGLAAEIQASLQSMSVVGANKLTGTPVYMAPEQWQGRTLTRGVDQWALAVMIYEMMAGRRPFEGPTETAIMRQIEQADPEPPQSLTPAQWTALKKAFSLDRKNRYRSCMALVKSLAAADVATQRSVITTEMPLPDEFHGQPGSAPASATVAAPAAAAAASAPARATQPAAPAPAVAVAPAARRPVAGLLVLALFGGAWFYQAQARKQKPPEQQEAEKAVREFAELFNQAGNERPDPELEKQNQRELQRQADMQAEQQRQADARLKAETEKFAEERRQAEAAARQREENARKELAARLAREAEARLQQERARTQLTAAVKEALALEAKNNWKQLLQILEAPLKAIDTEEHPDRRMAEMLLAKARAELARPATQAPANTRTDAVRLVPSAQTVTPPQPVPEKKPAPEDLAAETQRKARELIRKALEEQQQKEGRK